MDGVADVFKVMLFLSNIQESISRLQQSNYFALMVRRYEQASKTSSG
ncbi:MAG TPA: hypothetical protein VFL19_01575 [Nitrospira sp.]|nr:hypothetical protein [Nitrospira sp.]